MEIEKTKENIFEESKQKEQDVEEEPEMIKGDVRSHQDTSFIGIDSQGRPRLVETGDMNVHENGEKKEMEIEGGIEQGQPILEENQTNNENERIEDL